MFWSESPVILTRGEALGPLAHSSELGTTTTTTPNITTTGLKSGGGVILSSGHV